MKRVTKLVKRECPDCGVEYESAPQARACIPCRKQRKKEHMQRWRQNEAEKAKARARSLRRHYANRDEMVAAMRKRARARHFIRKITSLGKYGNRCVCCGEGRHQFLTLDHANGDGAKHRAELLGNSRAGGTPFLIALERAGWPDVPGLRTLCANCHMAIDLWGGCPHKTEEQEVSEQKACAGCGQVQDVRTLRRRANGWFCLPCDRTRED